ncbi:MAG TPA: GntR family transcriptional regulator [Anaerolineales bacterium]|nr:GntR family transcriptional regulator [Anaerolineales bacterium]
MATLDKASAIPLYFQLERWLIDRVADGELQPGHQIPSEQELCREFSLSRGTVRQALSELASEGHIYLVRGRGTFVAERIPDRWSLSSYVSISEALRQSGLAVERRVLMVGWASATPQVATALHIEPQAQVMRLKRLWLADGEPLMVGVGYLPERIGRELEGLDFHDRPLYATLAERFGVRITRVDRTLLVRLADVEECSLLQIPPGSPVQVLEERAYEETDDPGGSRPIEYSEDVIRGDRSRLEMQSRRRG